MWSDVLLDRDTDQRAVLGPGTVVVLDLRLVEDLVQHEPRVRGALTDPAVGDGVLAEVDALVLVERLQLVVAAEGAVVVRGLAPRDVLRGRDVTGALRLLLREVCRCEELAGELVRRTHVDEVELADRLDSLVAERADVVVRLLRRVRRLVAVRHLFDELAAVDLPLLTAAIEQLEVVVAVELEVPVRVGRKPVVVAAVEHDEVVVGDALLRQELLELLLVDEVAADLVLEVLLPV